MNSVTEKEARQKICPMSRSRYQDSAVHGGSMRCIGSECMAWTWVTREFHRETELWSKSKNRKVNSAYSDDADWRPVEPDLEVPSARGVCRMVEA